MVAKAEYWNVAQKILGFPGRMVSGSKSAHHAQYGTHFTIFNSNIFVEGIGKVWYGDVDLTKDEKKLDQLALALGRRLYVLYEMDGRFDEDRSDKKTLRMVSAYSTDGYMGQVGEKYVKYFYRSDKGLLLQKEG